MPLRRKYRVWYKTDRGEVICDETEYDDYDEAVRAVEDHMSNEFIDESWIE